jgi:protein SCO1/2
VLLVPVYYDCPMLCGQVLNSLTASLSQLSLDPGRDFEVVAVSFNVANTPDDALKSKNTIMGRFGRRDTAGGWHFLTGPAESIARFTAAIGFRFEQDGETGQFAHAAGFVVAAPDGTLSRYFFGLDFPERDLRLALVDASQQKIGSLADHVFLYCFRYDPATGRYTALALNIVRLAGATTVMLLVLGLVIAFGRERLRNRTSLGTA